MTPLLVFYLPQGYRDVEPSQQCEGRPAEYIVVPDRRVVPKQEQPSLEGTDSLPVAWSTAYRILLQDAGGGVTSAAITLATAAGARVYATSRTSEKHELALKLERIHEGFAAMLVGETQGKIVITVS